MLSQLDDVFLSTTIHKEFTFSSFALISSQLLISGLVSFLSLASSVLIRLILIDFQPGSLCPWPCGSDTFDRRDSSNGWGCLRPRKGQ
jgi:hypothetical protein